MTAAERREEFKTKLNALLIEYRCDLSASDEWPGYAECGQDIQIVAEFDYDIGTDEEITEDIKFGSVVWRQP